MIVIITKIIKDTRLTRKMWPGGAGITLAVKSAGAAAEEAAEEESEIVAVIVGGG
jgi:hypothetical protein